MSLMYYVGNNGATGYELFAVTEAGASVLIHQFAPGAEDSLSFGGGGFTNINGVMYMTAIGGGDDGTFNIYRVNGSTVTQITRFSEPNPVIAGTGAGGPFEFAGGIYFVQHYDDQPYQLWKISGNGAAKSGDLTPGEDGFYPNNFTELNGSLYYTALFSGEGYQLLRIGVSGDGARVTVPNTFSIDSFSGDPIRFGNAIYFAASTDATGTELYKVGANGAVSLVKDINPGDASASLSLSGATEFNGALYFSAISASAGSELWKINAAGNAVFVKDIAPGAVGSNASPALAVFNDEAYFTATTSGQGNELWKIKADGSAVLVADINPGTAGSFPSLFTGLTEFNGEAYFRATTAASGQELYKITASGAVVLAADVNKGAVGSATISSRNDLVVFNNALYFAASTEETGDALWRLNANGKTALVKNFYTGDEDDFGFSDTIKDLTVFNGALYMTAYTEADGIEAWRVDNTGATTRVSNNPGTANGAFGDFFIFPPEVDNAPPTNIRISKSAVNEFAKNGTVIGTLSGADPDTPETFTFKLAAASSLFAVNGNKFVVKNGFLLDFEQDATETVAIRVTDSAGNTFDKTLTIRIGDVNPERVTGDAGNNIFVGGARNDALTGLGGGDTLSGGDGNDTLNGGTGADRMTGGKGNDLFVADAAGDRIVEARNGGADAVHAGIDWTLGANIETLVLTGPKAVDGTGNGAANRITGNSNANIIDGGGGADTLTGGGGADTLTGGRGADAFLFSSVLGPRNVDTVSDFSVRDDTIRLDHDVFAGLKANKPVAFAHAGDALTGAPTVIYNDAKGFVLFDDDGRGGHAAIRFAIVDVNLALTANDFFVV